MGEVEPYGRKVLMRKAIGAAIRQTIQCLVIRCTASLKDVLAVSASPRRPRFPASPSTMTRRCTDLVNRMRDTWQPVGVGIRVVGDVDHVSVPEKGQLSSTDAPRVLLEDERVRRLHLL